MKKVLITGVSGQDGSILSKYILENTDNIVIGGIRRTSSSNELIEEIKDNQRFRLIDLDVTDQINTERVVQEEKPDYFINLAANSFVGNSWDMPVNHMMTNMMAVLYQLEAIRKYAPNCRYYNAGSSEQFGNVDYSPQDINHPLKPRSPYGVSKCGAYHLVKVYRESYNIYAVQGILFNHESKSRGKEFVTRKITSELARIKKAIDNKEDFIKPLELGNIDARRDWSHAEDMCDGIWKMLHQQRSSPFVDHLSTPKDYVLASGETHSIREFIEIAFQEIGIKGTWAGEGLKEEYVTFNFPRAGENRILVKINPKFYRPAEVDLLLGDPTLAKEKLGWIPKYSFRDLVKEMVEHDLFLESKKMN